MKKKLLIAFAACLALIIPIVGSLADEAFLTPGASEVNAGESLGVNVNLTAIPEEYLTYTLTVQVSPAPESVTVSENVNLTVNRVNGTYSVSSADLASLTALNFNISPGSALTSDTSYQVTATVTSEAGTMSEGCSFTAKAATEPVTPGEDEDDDKKGDLPGEDSEKGNLPSMNGGSSGSASGMSGVSAGTGSVSGASTTDESLVYAGSANNYLKKLSVKGYTFTRDFNKTRDSYFIHVKGNVKKMKVSATACDSSAYLSITGNDDVSENMSKIQINVTADNGDVRIYRIYVIHDEEEEE